MFSGVGGSLALAILGPLELRLNGGEPLGLGGVRQRAVLAILALNANKVVATERMIDELWRENSPSSAAHTVQVFVSRLRHAMGSASDRLATRPPGYRLELAVMEIDAGRCERLYTEARAANATGRPAAAETMLREALDLWRGPPLADFAYEPFAQGAIARLEELHVSCREELIDAQLALGYHVSAVHDLEALIAEHPLRERSRGQLMLALYRCGRQAEALDTYQQARHMLVEELAIEPSAAMRELEQSILRQDPALSVPAPSGADRESAGGHEAGSTTATDVAWAPRFPPALAAELGDEAFIGRDEALTRLQERYALAEAGKRQFVLLCGEPGIGKTRLASEFARDAYRQDAIVLYGRSDPEALVPYQPFITAIEQYIAECGQREFTRELEFELRELGRLIPGLRRHVPTLLDPLPVEPESRRYRMFDAVSRVLAFIARDRTAVLILDDLHWADTSTAVLVRHIVQQLHGVRLLIVATFRDSEATRSEDLAELLASRPDHGFERIALSGFDPSETAAFLVARQRRTASERFVSQLRSVTGGNPLFMEETLKSLAEAEPSERREAFSTLTLTGIEIPQRVNAVIAQRLLRLTDGARQLLAVASVVGAEFQLGLLEALIDQPTEQIISSLEEAEAAGLIREATGDIDRFSFSHALVREVLREQQSDSRRWRRHQQIGEALETIAETSTVNPAELAYHFFESRHSDRGRKAFRYSVEAGDRAADSFAHDEAAEQYERALTALEMQESPDQSQHCEVLLALGRVKLRQGYPQARGVFEHAAALARKKGLSELLGRAALGFASRYTEAGVVDDRGIALLREALDQLGDEPSALRAELTARLADSLHFAPEHEETLALSRAAIVLAREVDDTHALVSALVSRHAALLHITHLDERLTLSQELLDLAERVDERELAALGHHWRIYDLLEATEIDAARAEHRALVQLAKELRQPLYDHFSVGWDVVWANMAGRISEAEQLAEKSYELGRQAQARDAETVYWAQVVALRRREHRLADFVSTVQAASEQLPALMAWRTVLPLAHLAAGKLREAVEEFEWLADDHFSRVPEDMFWFTSVCVLAETCARIRDTSRATELYDMLLPYKDRNVQVTRAACWGSCERFLGLLAASLGNWPAASDHFEAAIAKNIAGGVAGAVSIVKRDYAEMLFARRADGDLETAMDLYSDTLQAAQDADMPQLIAHILGKLEEIKSERVTDPPRRPASSTTTAG
jgi:DNA-binding SARP family transcriptional activator